MRRLLWTAVGAAGGIYAYRRGQQALADARVRGLAGNMQVAAGTAATLLAQSRTVAALVAGTSSTTGPRPNGAGATTPTAALIESGLRAVTTLASARGRLEAKDVGDATPAAPATPPGSSSRFAPRHAAQPGHTIRKADRVPSDGVPGDGPARGTGARRVPPPGTAAARVLADAARRTSDVAARRGATEATSTSTGSRRDRT